MKVKIVQNKEIRVWKYPSHKKYHSLLSFISKTFGLSNTSSFNLQYQDDEGDNINITNDNDIDDALLCAKQESRKSLKIFLISHRSMDNFLDDALSDIFNTNDNNNTHTKLIQKPVIKQILKPKLPNIISYHNNKIHIPNPSSYPHSQHSQHSQQSNSRTMSPQEMIHMIAPNAKHKPMNHKLHHHNNNNVRMAPEDILNSMVISPAAASHQSNKNNIKPLEQKIEPKIEMNIHEEQKIDEDELLLQHLLNHSSIKKVSNSKPNKVNKLESDDDLLSSLLHENDKQMYKQQMDAQDIINSIVNKPEDIEVHNVEEIKENIISQSDEVNEMGISELKLDNNNNKNIVCESESKINGNSIVKPNANIINNNMKLPVPINPYYGQPIPANNDVAQPIHVTGPPQPIISTNVPPVPFHARSPIEKNDNIPNGNNNYPNNNGYVLALFNDLPDGTMSVFYS